MGSPVDLHRHRATVDPHPPQTWSRGKPRRSAAAASLSGWAATWNDACVDRAFELQQVGRPDLPWSEGISGFLLATCHDRPDFGAVFGDVAGEYAPGAFPP